MTKTKPAESLKAFAEEQERAKFAEHEPLMRTIRVLRAEVRTAKEATAAAKAEVAIVEKTLTLYERKYADRPEWLLPPKEVAPGRASILGCLSDLHAGETVRSAEVDGYNAYSLAICERRLERFFRRSIEIGRSWSAYRYDGAVLAVAGDLVSGDIHDELRETNECSTYQAVEWLIPRLCAGIDLWRRAFGKIHVVSAPGNHGRDSKIPRYKGRSAHNADTLLMRLVARELGKASGLSFEIPEALDASFSLYGLDFSVEHGDELARSFTGTAEIGVLGPLQRGSNRKKVALAAQGRSLDVAIWGHYHQLTPVPSRGFVANGSLKGYDEYARGLKLRPEPAQQYLAAVTEQGIETQKAVLVLDRKAEGW